MTGNTLNNNGLVPVKSMQGGFTLIELIISCFLTLLISALLYQSISVLTDSRVKFEQEISKIQQKQLTHRTLSKLIIDAADFSAADSELTIEVYFENHDVVWTKETHLIKLKRESDQLLHIAPSGTVTLMDNVRDVRFHSVLDDAGVPKPISDQEYGLSPTPMLSKTKALIVNMHLDKESWTWQFNMEHF